MLVYSRLYGVGVGRIPATSLPAVACSLHQVDFEAPVSLTKADISMTNSKNQHLTSSSPPIIRGSEDPEDPGLMTSILLQNAGATLEYLV